MGRPRNPNKKNRQLVAPEWSIQPKEKPENFEMFKMYRTMKKGRSLEAVLRSIGTPDHLLKNRIGWICRIAADWRWVERCELYEKWLDDQLIESEVQARRDMKKRHLKLAMSAQVATAGIIKEFVELKENKKISLDKMKSTDAFQSLFKSIEKLISASEFERKVRGEPDSVSVVHNTHQGYDEMNHDELLQKAKDHGFIKSK